MSFNNLNDEGVSAVCEAIQSNKETKLTSLNFGYNDIGPVGANAVAAMVAVTGALTSLDIRSNDIVGDGAAKLSAAVLGNLKIEMFNEIPIKEMRANSITELDLKGKGIGFEGGLVVAGLIPVMGALTSINLSGNILTNYGRDMTGITELAAALGVNGSLTSLDVRSNDIVGDGAAQLSAAVLGNLKIEMFNEIPIKEMRANSITELDLKEKRLGVEGGMVVAGLLPVMGSLTSINLSENALTNYSKDMMGINELAAALGANGALTNLKYVHVRPNMWAKL